MKIGNIIGAAVCVGIAAFLLSSCVTEQEREARLEAQAKVSRAEAEKIALAKAPGGTVKAGEIEREKGRVVWSFDIATPGTTDITEVLVDAATGEVVSVEKETPAQESKEKKESKAEKREKE